MLVWIVLWKLQVPFVGTGSERQLKLVPFLATTRAGASAPVEVVANVLLFVPFGIYLRLLAPTSRASALVGTTAGASVALEVVQYGLSVGRSDFSDVVANTAGGLVGVALVRLAHLRLRDRMSRALTWVCATGTLLS